MFAVAGVSGRTGAVVADTLLSQGKQVRVVVRTAEKGEPWRKRGADVAVASFTDERALVAALSGTAGFFALLPEDMTVPDFHGHRRRMADTLGRAIVKSQVPHVVFLSAIGAFLGDGNGPIKDLYHAENVIRFTNVKATIIRSGYFQENVLGALPAARAEGIYPSFLPSADAPFPTVATRDAGRLAARCLVEPPAHSEIIDVVGPVYSVRQMAGELGRAIGRELHVVDIPAAAQVPSLLKFGVPQQAAESLAEMFAFFGSGRISPHGDRVFTANTPIEEVLSAALA